MDPMGPVPGSADGWIGATSGAGEPLGSAARNSGSTVAASSQVGRRHGLPPDGSSDDRPAWLPRESPNGSAGGHRAPAPSRQRWFDGVLAHRQVLIPAAATVGVILLFIAYYSQAKTQITLSEGASQALQGWDLLHGNLLLHGWSLSDVSFYSTEIPEYALVEAVRGLSAATVPFAAALSYTILVVLAGWLARGGTVGREAWTRTLIAVGIMLAPTIGAATQLLMASPDHIGIHVPLFLIYLVIDRMRPRWWLPVVIFALLTWALIADELVLVEGALPIAAVAVVRMYRRRGPWRGQLYDLALLLGAGASAIAAQAALRLINALGGFYVRTPIAAFGTYEQISKTFWLKFENILLVFGSDFFGRTAGGKVLVAIIHLVGLALVIWAVARVVKRFYVEEDQIAQMLTVAFVGVFAAYLFGTKADANEIVGLLPIGAVLAGRVLGGKIVTSDLVPALSAVLVLTSVFLFANWTSYPKTNPNSVVASWLQAHHYKYGLAGYWNASSITAETGGRVVVRPIRTYQDGVLATNFETSSQWYSPQHQHANFVVWTNEDFCGDLCLKRRGILGAFGKPDHTYVVGAYVVLVYHRNLLPSVPYLGFCGTSWPWLAEGTPTRDLQCNSHA